MKAKKMAKKSSANDVVELILRDHKPLKKLIKSLKSEDITIARKRPLFAEFASLLAAHAKPEEKSLYVHMKEEDKLRTDAFEGDTEHAIADQLIAEIKMANDEDKWMAKVKVLAELVEHHIEEEEEDMLPRVKKEIVAEMREEIGEEYLRLRGEFMEEEEAA